MSPAASEITRDDLLALLRRDGLRVSRYQLLRWHDWGLLPQPRREGLGRGKGTASYYPRPAILQARTLARLLAKRRSLVEAGWGLWAIGFPVTPWAKEQLMGELKEQQRAFAKAARELRKGKGALVREVSRPRALRNLAKMRKDMPPDTVSRVLQMLIAYPLGTLRAEDYTDEEWSRFQGAVIREHWPGVLNDPDLPWPEDFAPEMAKLSDERSFIRVISALQATPDTRLEQYRNELQWLVEVLSAPDEQPTALMSRAQFVAYFKVRHMDPKGERGVAQLMRALGQTRPPPSQFQRWLGTMAQLRATAQSPNQ